MIEFKNVTKTFGSVRALDGFTVSMEDGKIIGLLGPNGTGKSTCLKMIAGLNKPDFGIVEVDGVKPSKETKRKITFLPEIDHLYPWMTVEQIANFLSGFFADWDWDKYKELIKFLDLQPSLVIGKISKGMRAKAKLLFTFSRNAKIVLLDEPLSGIDVLVREKIIQTIVRDYGLSEQTIIISTHEVAEIEPLIEKVIFMEAGKVKLEGDVEDLRFDYGKSLVDIMKEVYGNENK
jgi:ABC-2 type transport system ATP-binding protein